MFSLDLSSQIAAPYHYEVFLSLWAHLPSGRGVGRCCVRSPTDSLPSLHSPDGPPSSTAPGRNIVMAQVSSSAILQYIHMCLYTAVFVFIHAHTIPQNGRTPTVSNILIVILVLLRSSQLSTLALRAGQFVDNIL